MKKNAAEASEMICAALGENVVSEVVSHFTWKKLYQRDFSLIKMNCVQTQTWNGGTASIAEYKFSQIESELGVVYMQNIIFLFRFK